MKHWRGTLAAASGWAAGVALAAMMLLTLADVLMRAFMNQPIRGVIELVELLLACSFFLALPAVFLRDSHLVVDVVDRTAPRAVGALRRAGELLAIVVLALMAWEGWKAAKDTLVFGDVTSDLGIPRIYYWIPVLAGIAASVAAAAAMMLRRDRE